MAKKKIKVTIEVTIDEDEYDDIAQGKTFDEAKKEILELFDDEKIKDVKIDFEEISD